MGVLSLSSWALQAQGLCLKSPQWLHIHLCQSFQWLCSDLGTVSCPSLPPSLGLSLLLQLPPCFGLVLLAELLLPKKR